MKVKDIVNAMDNWAKKELIDSWDNTGFQVGNIYDDVERVLISLDVNEEVLDIAVKDNYQLIVTHHPIIFKPLKAITNEDYKESLIIKAIKNNINIYNAHSNLDLAEGGVNHVLADLFSLENHEFLRFEVEDEGKTYGYGRIGDISKIDTLDFLNNIKNILNIDKIKVYGNVQGKISRVALCGGSGSEFINDAKRLGADIFITGDIKYHDAELATQLGLVLVDAGHYHTEKIILKEIKEYLESNFKDNLGIRIYEKPSVECQLY